jgi:tetratricopeptide (TPR) repeat protein
MTLQRIKEIFSEGKYQGVLDLLSQKEVLVELANSPINEQIECIYYECYSLEQVGQYEESLRVAVEARRRFMYSKDKSHLPALFTAHLWALFRLGRIDEALEVISDGETIIETLSIEQRESGANWIAFFEHRKGDIYYASGDMDKALEHWKRGLTLREALGDLKSIAHSLYNLGTAHAEIGRLDIALKYLQRSNSIGETLSNYNHCSHCLSQIGITFIHKGELDAALENIQQGLRYAEKGGNPLNIASLLNWLFVNIYLVYTIILKES